MTGYSTLVAALIATEGLYSTVGADVPLEVCSLCEGMAALFAGKRFLTSVGENVCL